MRAVNNNVVQKQMSRSSRHRRGSARQIGGDNRSHGRVSIACGRCRKRKIRCSGQTPDGMPCEACQINGCSQCEYLRVSSHATTLRTDVLQRENVVAQPSSLAESAPYREHFEGTFFDASLPFAQDQAHEYQSINNRDWSIPKVSLSRNFGSNMGLDFPAPLPPDRQYFSNGTHIPLISYSDTLSLEPGRTLPYSDHSRWIGPYPEYFQDNNFPVNEFLSPPGFLNDGWVPNFSS